MLDLDGAREPRREYEAAVTLESFTRETFAPHVGSTFQLAAGESSAELVLDSADAVELDASSPTGPGRLPFSLIFSGPITPILEQRTYDTTHPVLGSFPLFIVPIGPAAGRMQYEAVFY